LRWVTGKTQQEITAARKGARANHVGVALSRHKRAGRIEADLSKVTSKIPSFRP
jgi:hypothetical protein